MSFAHSKATRQRLPQAANFQVEGLERRVLLSSSLPLVTAPGAFPVGPRPRSVAVADLNGDGAPDIVAANYGYTAGNTVSVLLSNGNGTFQAQATLAAGPQPAAVAIADVNGDGKPDLIVADAFPGSPNYLTACVSVLLGNGNGTFGAPRTFLTGPDPASVVVADVNSDGKPDIVVADSGLRKAPTAVSILIGNGDGTFGFPQTLAGHSDATSVAVADVDGDGKPDLIETSYSGPPDIIGILTVWQNTGNTFQAPQTFSTGPAPESVVVADVNADGKADVITANHDDNAVSVLLGNGNGTFQAAQSFSAGLGPRSVAVADLNGDGKPDLVVADSGSNDISVLLGNGNGTFGTHQEFLGGFKPLSIAVADVNGDGKPDAVFANYGDATVGLLLGTGRGTLQVPQFSVTGSPKAIAAADLNGDGKTDLIVGNQGTVSPYRSGSISILLGNGNGTFQGQQTIAGVFSPSSIYVADLNGDGIPDLVEADSNANAVGVSDVGVLLGNGNGTFRNLQTFPVSGTPTCVVASDVNGDGIPDLIVSTLEASAYSNVSVFLGRGDGTFQFYGAFLGGYFPEAVSVADVNHDGKPDLIVADGGGNIRNTITVLLGDGHGDFNPSGTFPLVAIPHAVTVCDLNGDGNPDIVVAPGEVFLGNGNGTFQGGNVLSTSGYSVAVSDFNGDGINDLVMSNGAPGGTISVMLGNGNGTFAPPAVFDGGYDPAGLVVSDFTGDGKPSVAVVNNVSIVSNSGGFGRVSVLIGTVSRPDTITVGSAGHVVLSRDLDRTDIDWATTTASGWLSANDANGLTINGNGGNDAITLDYTNGNPLPNILHLNSGTGNFTINGLQGTNPLAGTTMDIGRSTVFIGYSSSDPIAAIQSYLHDGYNAGAWNGSPTASTGVITSAAAAANPNHTTAIGYADIADGQGINTTPNTIELTYTLYGDANLDHVVNSADLQRFLNFFNTPGAWDQSDFNYDGVVNSADQQLILFTFNASLGSQATPLAVAATPAAETTSASGSASDPSSQLMPAIKTEERRQDTEDRRQKVDSTEPTITPTHHAHPAKPAARNRR